MRHAPAIAVIVLFTSPVTSGKSPAESSTVCDRYRNADIIFTGSAETRWMQLVETRRSPVHKRSEKSKRVRFLAREWFKGERRNAVDVWIGPSECPLKVETNQTYLIYAHLNKEKGRVESNGCMGTVAVGNAASDMAYLTAAQHGPAQATRISGKTEGQGVNIQAKSGIMTRYAVSDAGGQFTFDGLPAGKWQLSVAGGSTSKDVDLEPGSCVAVALQ